MTRGLAGLGRLDPAAAALGVAVFAISWAAVLYRLSGVGGAEAAWWRLLVGVAFTAAACAAAGGCAWGRWARLSALGGVMLALHFSSWFESLRLTSVAVSTSAVVTYPVFILFIERVVEGLPLTPPRVGGVALAVAGVAVMAEPWGSRASPAGVGLALLAALAGALYFYAGRLARTRGAPTLAHTLAAYSSALAAVTLYLAAARDSPLDVPARSLPYLAALGLVPMIAGHTLLNYAMKRYPASMVTTAALLEPLGASILAYIILGETPSPAAALGGAMVVAGAAVVTLSTPTD